jgi:hypothetical protein
MYWHLLRFCYRRFYVRRLCKQQSEQKRVRGAPGSLFVFDARNLGAKHSP